jgi:hypothetical protein
MGIAGDSTDFVSLRAALRRELQYEGSGGLGIQWPALWPPSICRISPVTKGAFSRYSAP